MGDFDGDGAPDAATTTHTYDRVELLFGSRGPDGVLRLEDRTMLYVEEPRAIAAADFNRDGHSDLAVLAVEGGG